MKKLLQMNNSEVFPYLEEGLYDIYPSHKYESCYRRNEFLFFCNSKSPILLQAHIDTVRDEKKELKIFGDKILYANGILGADDRAGIYAIMEICRESSVLPNLLFTNGEETGGSGMRKFTHKFKSKHLKHINLCIALDRQGVGEYVTYNDLPLEVSMYMESFGFTEHEGSFSDCQIFTSKYRIPSVNVSVGYHHQHTASECLHIDEMEMTIFRLLDILVNPIDKLYKSTGHPKWEYDFSNYSWGKYSKNSKPLLATVKSVYDEDYCDYCGKKAFTYYLKDEQIHVCGDCYDYFQNKLYLGGAIQ